MPTHITLRSEPLSDPRGLFHGTPVRLAGRPTDLRGKRVLLLDNGQLTALAPGYGPVFQWLAQRFEAEQGARCLVEAHNLLAMDEQRLDPLAAALARRGLDAAVIALCHAGVTQPSRVLAGELERRGIPCVLICTELGLPLAAITAATYVPGLPLVLARPAAASAEAFGRGEAEAIAPEVTAGLTTPAADLLEQFGKRFSAEGGGLLGRDGDMRLSSTMTVQIEEGGRAAVEIDPGRFAADLYAQLCAADMCDGFPVIPPTKERVRAMLAFSDLDADHVLVGGCPPSGADITLLSVAVNAVMAGCRPEYFPVLVAAFQAMADPAYRLFQGAITTHPAGNAVVVSGPLAGELGIHSGAGCMGPGFRANATIGRAITLVMLNVARAIPGKSDLTVFGSAAEFSYCFAESEGAHPWTPLHADLYGADVTSVTVHKCEGAHNVIAPNGGGPETLLDAMASTAATLGGNNLPYPGQLLVMLNPGHAKMIAGAGWSKRDVQQYLFETARHPMEVALRQRDRASHPPEFLEMERVPVMRSPDDVIVVVCGGPGPHAMVGVPWGLSRAVSRPVALRDGRPLRTVRELAGAQ